MKSNYAERIAKGSFIIFTMSLVSAFIGYSLRLFLSRSLSVEEFGLFYSVLIFLSAFSVFKDFGLGSALVKYISSFMVKRDFLRIKASILYVAITHFIAGFVVFIILLVFSDYIIANFFQNPLAAPVFWVLLIEFLFTTSFFGNTFQGFQKMKFLSLVEFLRVSIVFVLVIFLIKLGVVGVAYSYLGSTIAVQFIFFYLLLRTFPKFLKERFVLSRVLYSRLWKFGLSLFIGSFSGMIISYSSTILITFFSSLEEVGYFQIALPTSQLLWVFPISIAAILFPTVSEMWTRGQKSSISRSIELLIKFSFIFIIPGSLILMSFPEIIIRLLPGESYMPAAFMLQILSVSAITFTLYSISSHLIIGIGKPLLNSKILYVVAVFNVAMNILLIPVLGGVGAAITTVLSYFIGFVLSVYFVRCYVSLSVPWGPLFKTLLGGFSSLVIIFTVKGMLAIDPIIEAVISLTLAFAFYFLSISLSKIVTKSDVMVLRDAKVPKFIINILVKVLRK